MTAVQRAFLSTVAVLALLASGTFIFTTTRAQANAGQAGRSLALAPPPVAYLAAAFLAPAAPPQPKSAPPVADPISPVPGLPGAPLVFNHPGASEAADARVASIAVFDAPGAAVPVRSLSNPTQEGVPLVLLVKQRRGDWLRVQLPIRPNETFGWVKAADVSVRTVPNHIVVEVANRRLSAWKGSELLMQTPVGVGKSKTPTPPGNFYVDISVKNPGGAYGRHMLSVAGFSNVLQRFGTGIGQVAIHGTNQPSSVGQFSSNGCMRLTNEAIQKLSTLAGTGTPVFIVP
ncbi:MAG: L,D-transpeptidase [Actinomycetota bacterium]